MSDQFAQVGGGEQVRRGDDGGIRGQEFDLHPLISALGGGPVDIFASSGTSSGRALCRRTEGGSHRARRPRRTGSEQLRHGMTRDDDVAIVADLHHEKPVIVI
ncbi:hypothetical protein AB0H88_40110 [Nonomuraea sp. NPDC050680]|uniref:hypothetical protein n=1 Tax=Nonomuraea sp. NPDC050680 TaxID=3154630 RepID=UPI0034051535